MKISHFILGIIFVLACANVVFFSAFWETAEISHGTVLSVPALPLRSPRQQAQPQSLFYYEAFEFADVAGNDFGSVRSGDIAALKRVCDSVPECKSFNANGWLKTSSDDRVPSATTLYVKMPHDFRELSWVESESSFDGLDSELSEMLRRLKIYIYPLPARLDVPHVRDYKYGVESMFESTLKDSAFVTTDPIEATFFFLPVRCAAHRYRVASRALGQEAAENAVADIFTHIQTKFTFWNQSVGADHFYVCAHDMGASCAAKTPALFRKNTIALVNTADYDDMYFAPHKDIALPPHPGDGCPTCTQGSHTPLRPANTTRSLLAFFAGNMAHGRVRQRVLELWGYDPDLVLVDGALSAEVYHGLLQRARFCLVLRGHRGWSPRLLDAVWAGCVPVVVADHYHLPLQGLVDWSSFAVLLPERQLPELKVVLQRITPAALARMQRQLARVQGHFTWHRSPQPGDAFFSVLTMLWRRRHVFRSAQSP